MCHNKLIGFENDIRSHLCITRVDLRRRERIRRNVFETIVDTSRHYIVYFANTIPMIITGHGVPYNLKINRPLLDSVRRERPISDYQPRARAEIPQSSLSVHDIRECSDEQVITTTCTWMKDVLSISGELCVCVCVGYRLRRWWWCRC